MKINKNDFYQLNNKNKIRISTKKSKGKLLKL